MKITIETELDDDFMGIESCIKAGWKKHQILDCLKEDYDNFFNESTKWTLRYKGVKIEDE